MAGVDESMGVGFKLGWTAFERRGGGRHFQQSRAGKLKVLREETHETLHLVAMEKQDKPVLVVLSGAGISRESGIKTFRDGDGLWEDHDVMEVATPEAWQRNPALVQRFYNARRRQLDEVVPNAAHVALAELESHFDVHIVTQNVDDLHERAGSTQVLHLHGELRKVRPVDDPGIDDARLLMVGRDVPGPDVHLGDTDDRGVQLRPHVVWFGEAVPMMEPAVETVEAADALLVVGTSMQVYPAAGLVNFARPGCPITMVNPDPDAIAGFESVVTEFIQAPASEGVARWAVQQRGMG